MLKSKDINDAIHNNDTDRIASVLAERPALLTTEYFGVLETPLHYCARHGCLNVFKFLVEKGLDMNVTVKGYETPLNAAAGSNHMEIAVWLLEQGAYVDGVESNLLSPLMCAVIAGHFEMVQLLVQHGANVNRMHIRNGRVPLDYAISRKDTRIADYLKLHGAKSYYILPEWVENEISGSGILGRITLKLGKILPVDITVDSGNKPVVQKLIHSQKYCLLFTFGLFDFHQPMMELLIVLPQYWNFYVQTAKNQFSIQLLTGIIELLKTGRNLSEGDYILSDDDHFKELNWPETIAAFRVVRIKWSELNDMDQNLTNKEEVVLYTLMPVKRTKAGFSREDIEKSRSAGWRKLTLQI